MDGVLQFMLHQNVEFEKKKKVANEKLYFKRFIH